MHQSVYIATKTKDLVDIMNEIITISLKNNELRTDVDMVVVGLSKDSDTLQAELSKFKI
jgi:hypothetical protein